MSLLILLLVSSCGGIGISNIGSLKYASKSQLRKCVYKKQKKQPKIIYHKLKQGENLYQVSKRYNTSVDEIIETNNIRNIYDIPVGKVLKIKSTKPMNKLAWPLRGQLTSKFGWRKRNFHHGIDISNKKGTKFSAADHGVVILSGKNIKGFRGYGKVIVLQHSKNLITLYAHNNKNFVSKGDCVKRNEIIGEVGESGISTGPHLHFEVRKNKQPVNPLLYLR